MSAQIRLDFFSTWQCDFLFLFLCFLLFCQCSCWYDGTEQCEAVALSDVIFDGVDLPLALPAPRDHLPPAIAQQLSQQERQSKLGLKPVHVGKVSVYCRALLRPTSSWPSCSYSTFYSCYFSSFSFPFLAHTHSLLRNKLTRSRRSLAPSHWSPTSYSGIETRQG